MNRWLSFLLVFLGVPFVFTQDAPWLIDGWSTTTPVPELYVMGAVSYQDHILIFVHNGHVYRGRVLSDGQIDEWADTTPLPVPLYYRLDSAVAIGRHVVIPAAPASYIGEIGPSGDILSWLPGPAVTSPATAGRVSAVDGNRIYTLGGGWDWLISDRVEMATLDDAGALSEWAPQTPLPEPIHDPMATVIDEYLYVFGGESYGGDMGPSWSIHRAPIAADGTLGDWEDAGLLLHARSHANYLSYGGTIHVVGGGVHSYMTASVESALLGEFSLTDRHVLSQPLPVPMNEHQAVVVRHFGYIFGGNTSPYGGVNPATVFFTTLGEGCIFGPGEQPVEFLRAKGKPVVETLAWDSCGGEGFLLIANDGVSAAVMELNGERLLDPSAFNPHVTELVVPVSLLAGRNVLTVELRSQPGSSLAIFIEETK
ncbi:MAG: hypothetical protein GX414_00965 [Acidobacteria bacterium]|nr:hypothetical protein [Acidobacteriota bacterium]